MLSAEDYQCRAGAGARRSGGDASGAEALSSSSARQGRLQGQSDLVALRELIRRVAGARADFDAPDVVPVGIGSVDALLPGGGLPRGAVTEVLFSSRGVGAATLAVRAAAQAVQRAGHVVLVGPPGADGMWYPPALAQAGLPIDRLLLVEPATRREAVWAAREALRCRGVGAVIATFGRLDLRTSRLFQLAAERGGGLGLILRRVRDCARRRDRTDGESDFVVVPELSRRSLRTFAAVQLWVSTGRAPPPTAPLERGGTERGASSLSSGSSLLSSGRSLSSGLWRRVDVLKTRQGRPAEALWAWWSDATGDVFGDAVFGRRAGDAEQRCAGA